MSAVEKILEEVKLPGDEEKKAVLRAPQREVAAERFERVAGALADPHAGTFVAEIYSRRRGAGGRHLNGNPDRVPCGHRLGGLLSGQGTICDQASRVPEEKP